LTTFKQIARNVGNKILIGTVVVASVFFLAKCKPASDSISVTSKSNGVALDSMRPIIEDVMDEIKTSDRLHAFDSMHCGNIKAYISEIDSALKRNDKEDLIYLVYLAGKELEAIKNKDLYALSKHAMDATVYRAAESMKESK